MQLAWHEFLQCDKAYIQQSQKTHLILPLSLRENDVESVLCVLKCFFIPRTDVGDFYFHFKGCDFFLFS